jgi:hypothetical protein
VEAAEDVGFDLNTPYGKEVKTTTLNDFIMLTLTSTSLQ